MHNKLILAGAVAIVAALLISGPALAWSKQYQASYYGYGTTASGKHITDSTHYVAVPIHTVVKRSTWKHMSKANKAKHFYYGEKLTLKHGKYKDTVTVQDCGGFARCGQWKNGRWCKRLFDVTPAVRRALHITKSQGVALVRYKRIN